MSELNTATLATLIEESRTRERDYLRATNDLQRREIHDQACKIGALTAIARMYRTELADRGELGVVAIIDEVLAR